MELVQCALTCSKLVYFTNLLVKELSKNIIHTQTNTHMRVKTAFLGIPLTWLVSGAGGDNTEWPWASTGIGPDSETVFNELLQLINH